VQRHRTHCQSIQSKLSFDIKINIDQPIRYRSGARQGLEITLRDIILDITVADKDSPLCGTKLFHAIDYVGDSGKLWIENQRGPGGSCYILSYYRQVESEATTMITGLGKYVLKQYGKQMAARMFHPDHFQAIKGWKYDIMTGLFHTPEMKQIKSNLRFDNNLKAIKILQDLNEAEEKKLEAEKKKKLNKAMLLQQKEKKQKTAETKKTRNNSRKKKTSFDKENKEDASTIDMVEYTETMEVVELNRKRNDPDLDSINENHLKQVDEIVVSDNNSVTSGLTDGTINSDTQSISNISDDTYKSKNTNNTKTTINQKVISSIINDTTLTNDEICEKVEKYHRYQFQKSQISCQSQIELFLQSQSTQQEDPSNESSNTKNNKNKLKKQKSKKHLKVLPVTIILAIKNDQ